MISQHLVKEELSAPDGERGPDIGRGQDSPKLEEVVNSQYLVNEFKGAEGSRGPGVPGVGPGVQGANQGVQWVKGQEQHLPL